MKNGAAAKAAAWSKAKWEYVSEGVWKDPRDTILVQTLKIINLSLRSFFNKDLQSVSMSLTYSTVLAIVPALALLFAIGRGFGFQNLLVDNLYRYLPSQSTALSAVLEFVDSYLSQASQGVFVGVGLVMLLWTMISLMGRMEAAFNKIWDVKRPRTIYRKLSDYTSICLMVPILMVCSSGISIFMSSAMAEMGLFTPLIGMLLDASPFFLVCLAFTLLFLLIPNTKVRFRYAFLSGVICGISFQILQLLFVNGQIYVSKYNAIYGSFAFLPLLLIWLQLSWLILLFGCMLTYSAQNVFVFNYADDIRRISRNYYSTMAVGVMAVVVRRQWLRLPPLSNNEIAAMYGVPVRLATFIADRLHHAGLIYFVMETDDEQKLVPAVDLSTFSVGALLTELDADGSSDFIVEFDIRNKDLKKIMNPIYEARYLTAADKLLKDIEIAPDILANNKSKRDEDFKI